MYLVSLHGHAIFRAWPGSSGAPTEWRAGTKSAFVSSIAARTSLPMRAMTVIEART